MLGWETYRHETMETVSHLNWEERFALWWPKDIQSLSETPQSPLYHAEGDVWTHTKMVVNELHQHPRYQQATPIEQTVLTLAGMLHDIAKPYTTKEINGQVIAPHHSKKGAVWAREALWKMNVPYAIREQVAHLILYHQTPFYALTHSGQTGEYLARKLSCDVDLSLLCALAESDIRGRVCPDQQQVLDNIALFSMMAEDLGCLHNPYAWPDQHTQSQYVRGHGKIDANTAVFLPSSAFPVYMMCGLPASGKDTWAQQQNLPVVSYDDTRKQLRLKHGEETGKIVHSVHDQARALLRKKQPFVWNATHLSSSMRQPAMDLIRQYGGWVKMVCLEAPMETLLERNRQRDNTLTNDKLLQMVQHWEMPMAWEAEHMIITHTLDRKPKMKW